MRDIRSTPQQPKKKRLPMPDDDSPIAELSKPPVQKNRRRFTGSKVPVTNVHLPKQTLTKHQHSAVSRTPKKIHSAKSSDISPTPSLEKRPLFAMPNKAAQKNTRTPMRIGQKERVAVAALFALIIVAGLLAGYIFLPKANIALVLQTAPLLVDEKLSIQSKGAADGTSIPGAVFFREVPITGTAPVNSTEIVGTKASGTVTIVNKTTEEQKIREQSRLVTKDGQLFYMQKHAIIPPSSSVSVPLEADLAGPAGNIQPQRLNFAGLDESSQSLVYGENTNPLTGGTGEQIHIVKQDDLEQAKQSAGSIAKDQAEQEIRQELPKGWVVLEESWDTALPVFETAAKEGDKISEISYTGRAVVRVLGYEDSKLQEKLQAALENKLDRDFQLFPGPISFAKSVDNVNWETGEGTIAVRVTHTTIPNFSLDTLKDKLAGRNKDEAQTYLEGLKGVKQASIDLWPFWVNSIPRIQSRITLDLQSDREP